MQHEDADDFEKRLRSAKAADAKEIVLDMVAEAAIAAGDRILTAVLRCKTAAEARRDPEVGAAVHTLVSSIVDGIFSDELRKQRAQLMASAILKAKGKRIGVGALGGEA